jgi:uncharacterized membrane protein HdeD (DUF308 family)
MAATMTPGERQAMDDLSDYASKTWGVYLFSGIVSILFGVLVLSLEIDWIDGARRGVTASYLVALLIGAWLIGWGILQILGALGDRRENSGWYVLGGIISIGAGILAWSWPDATYAVLVVIIGWALILWGVIDIIGGFAMTGTRHWWVYLLRGLASIVLGILAVAWVNIALFFVLLMIGLGSILWGIGDITAAFMLHGAKSTWKRDRAAGA